MKKQTIVRENTVARRNPVALSLQLGQFQARVVKSRKLYSRKNRSNRSED